MKIGLVSLGCSKNLVDSEILLGKLKGTGAQITPNPEEADVIIINTCGFIEPAKLESIETILEFAEKGKEVIVMGCLVERYKEELKREIPEVKAYFGTESWNEILEYLNLKEKGKSFRLLTTRSYAYLKIAEGCNRLCSFCSIPSIRGRHRSRRIEEVVEEAKKLAQDGVKELCIVSQDTTYYGKDLYREYKLIELLKELEKIEGIKWIRLLYLYPTEVKDELLDFISDSEKVVPYFDIPVQHISDKVLRDMRRGYDGKFVRSLIEKIKKKIPQAVIRTSLIVGFPTEEEKDFRELLSFVEEGHFHWLGVFTYSHEEGTYAYSLGDKVPKEVKEERMEEILKVQREITRKKNEELLGREFDVIVDGYDEEFSFVPKGRAYFQAPEVDGVIYLETLEEVKPGEVVRVKINQFSDYDLGGEVLKEGFLTKFK
ncbi:30S ribosomal protein S12 methylthiotransferase RimO [Aquifex sp.]